MFEVDGEQYPTCEISEGGMRILCPDDAGPGMDELEGLLQLPDEVVQLQGRVLRRDEDELILVLSEGIPFGNMMREQRRLLKAYPALFGREA